MENLVRYFENFLQNNKYFLIFYQYYEDNNWAINLKDPFYISSPKNWNL